MLYNESNTSSCCPYVENTNPACSSRFTLGKLDQACSVCFGAYQTCSVYQRVSGKQKTTLLDLTINDHVVELRPTGS
jgi:hypothetical protein